MTLWEKNKLNFIKHRNLFLKWLKHNWWRSISYICFTALITYQISLITDEHFKLLGQNSEALGVWWVIGLYSTILISSRIFNSIVFYFYKLLKKETLELKSEISSKENKNE